jgi:hypothetical protein
MVAPIEISFLEIRVLGQPARGFSPFMNLA